MKVVIAEDTAVLRAGLVQLLTEEGYEVAAAVAVVIGCRNRGPSRVAERAGVGRVGLAVVVVIGVLARVVAILTWKRGESRLILLDKRRAIFCAKLNDLFVVLGPAVRAIFHNMNGTRRGAKGWIKTPLF